MKSRKYSSNILEIPVHLLPDEERNQVEAKYFRKHSEIYFKNFFDNSKNLHRDNFYRRCSDILAMSNVLGVDPFELSVNVSTRNSSLNSDISKPLSKISHHSNSLSSTLHNSLEGCNVSPQSPASNVQFNIPRIMHPRISFEIDIPINNSRLTSRRSSKSLEFSSLQFAEEIRQETIPESVMEHIDCPTPCKAHSAIANGDIENNGSSVSSTILVCNKNLTGYKIIQKNRRRWPSMKTKSNRCGSISKSDHIQHSVPLIHRCINNDDTYETSENIAHLSCNIDTKFATNIAKMPYETENQFNDDDDDRKESENDEDNDHQLNGDLSSKTRTSNYLKEQFFSFFQPSDNKLALKLFGNKNAVNKERCRQRQQGKLVIHPCSNFRFYWDLMMLVLLITNLIVLPVAISFFNDDLSLHWIVFNCVSDTIFILDIAVNFRTGIITNDFADEIILDPKVIARRYVKSWFILDLLSSIPMDYLFLVLNHGQEKNENYSQFLHAGRTLRIFRLAKLLSMLRLLRLSRLVRYVSEWEEFLNMASKFIGICKLVLLMLLLGHWNACLQFLIPMLMEYPAESWVIKCNLKDAYWFKQYTWALFKAMSHMLSIGYGRFPPTSISEAWITIVSMMTGATCYALFVGHAAAIIQSFDTSKRLYREKFKQVEEYMAYRKLPRALRQRIANYYEHRYQGKMFDEDVILTELSECLREQIINYNCRALVAAVPFFTYADQDFVSEVVTKLKFEVFQPGDLIIKEGTIGTKMFFIQEGIVDIITKEGEVATSLSDGSYFGEICLLTNAKRVASVRAETYCNLYSLDAEHFQAVLENYPLMRRTMESVAAERLSKIGKNPQIVSSRENLKEDLNLVKEIVSSVTPLGSDEDDDDDDNKINDDDSDFIMTSSPFKLNRKKKLSDKSESSKNDFKSFQKTKAEIRYSIQNILKLKKSKSNLSFPNVLKRPKPRKPSYLLADKNDSKKFLTVNSINATKDSGNSFPFFSDGAFENQLQILVTPSPTSNNPPPIYSISNKESCL